MSKQDKLELINSDPKLWLKNFVKIIDNNGDLIPFVVNEQQDEFLNKMSKYNIISKSRQLGFSTLSLGLCLYDACTKPNTNYLIVSYKMDSASALFEKLKMMNNHLPRDKYNFPKTKRDNRGELLLDNGSRIQSVVAGSKSLGRGSTYQYILLSEFAFYQNQEKVLLSSEQSLAKNESSKVVIETTSNGFNHYQKVFMKAWKGHSKYKAFFFPFYSSAYKTQFKQDHDQAEKWFKLDNHGKRLQAKDLEKDEKVLYENGANLRFLMWRRWKLLDMTLQEFMQEYPSNPMESFISTGQSVFDQSKILERLNYLLPIIEKNELGDLPNVLQSYVSKSLFIYHLPKRNKKYYGGTDVSSGSGGDNSTIAIYNDEGEQVASFYDNKTPVYVFAEIINELGRYYNQAFLVVERNSYGLPLLERLRNQHRYQNLYKQKLFDQKGNKKMQLGWTTTAATKGIMISDFKEQFERGLMNINCKETLEEMQIFVENEGRTGNKRGENNHDDLVIANALAIQGIKTGKWYVDL